MGLTDAEIIKALECCIGWEKCKEKQSPMINECEKDVDASYRYALDLINRLQADRDNYKQIAENQQTISLDRGFEIKRLKEKVESQQAENERLKATIDCFTDIGKLYSEVKAEAYKEFAELVHCHCQSIINQEWNKKVAPVSWADAYEQFDDEAGNLLKELVGEDNG